MRPILIALLMTLAGPISAQDFYEGVKAYENRDFATALKQWRPLAEGGDSAAQYNLGMMYKNGEGVPKDYKKALKWYRLAVEQGFLIAPYNLGLMYGMVGTYLGIMKRPQIGAS